MTIKKILEKEVNGISLEDRIKPFKQDDSDLEKVMVGKLLDLYNPDNDVLDIYFKYGYEGAVLEQDKQFNSISTDYGVNSALLGELIKEYQLTRNYDRRDPAVRAQYKTLIECLKCEGEKGCDKYIIAQNSTNKTCGWYRTLLMDQEKLRTGEGILTFPILEKILEDQKDLEELPSHINNLYVNGCNYMKT